MFLITYNYYSDPAVFNKIYQTRKRIYQLDFVFLAKIFKSEKVIICSLYFSFSVKFCPGLLGAGGKPETKGGAAVLYVQNHD